jgi:restriction endonuclease S subunit
MQCFTVWSNEIERRIDPLYYSLDIFSFLKDKKYEIKAIGEVTKYLKTGFAAGKQEQAEDKGNGIIQIRPTNIDEEGQLYFDKNIYLKNEYLETKRDEVVQKGEVLFNNTNSQDLVGKTTNFDLEGSYFCSNHITRIKAKENVVNPQYLTVILNLYQKKKIFFNICTNWNNQSGVNIELLKTVNIPLPPLPIQNQIVEVMQSAYTQKKQKEAEARGLLASIDDYVLDELGIKLPEVEDKMCFVVNSEELKEKRADSYYYQPRFIKLIDAMRKTPFEIETLEDLSTKIINGLDFREFTKTGIPYLRVSNIKPNSFDVSDVKFIPAFSISKDIELDSGDLLITRKGTYGISVIVDDGHKSMVISSEIFRIVLKKDNVNPHYIAIYLNSNIPKQLFNRISTGGIMGHLSQDALKNIQIIFPPLEIQNKIAEEVKRRINEAEKLKAEASKIIEEAKNKVEKIILGGVI